jgi:hypothetical protein
MQSRINTIPVSDKTRTLLGFFTGLLIMTAIVQVFQINHFDFNNMQRGVQLIFSGVNPWAVETRIPHYYNPPFAILFLWPMLFATPKIYLVLGGALLFAFVFYRKAWVAFAWFATNTFLWLVSAGGIDMFVIGAGLLLLIAADHSRKKWLITLLRVLAYGILLVKPQGGMFIVAFYILLRRDWLGTLIALVVYGLPFLSLYPDWIHVILSDPPLAQTVASHTLLEKFGPWLAGMVAVLVLTARRWKYWQLGGALAGILMPYGMPGLPIFLTLTAVPSLKAIPAVVVSSALLAILTWLNTSAGAVTSDYHSHLMSIYHLGMLGLALVLSCTSEPADTTDSIAVVDWLKAGLIQLKTYRRAATDRTAPPLP